MIKLILLSLFVTFSLSQTLHAKIFKWTDSEGKVHYSATPPKDATLDKNGIPGPGPCRTGPRWPAATQASRDVMRPGRSCRIGCGVPRGQNCLYDHVAMLS